MPIIQPTMGRWAKVNANEKQSNDRLLLWTWNFFQSIWFKIQNVLPRWLGEVLVRRWNKSMRVQPITLTIPGFIKKTTACFNTCWLCNQFENIFLKILLRIFFKPTAVTSLYAWPLTVQLKNTVDLRTMTTKKYTIMSSTPYLPIVTMKKKKKLEEDRNNSLYNLLDQVH